MKAPNAETSDRFGHAVALSGDTLAVGAPYEDGCGTSIINNAAGYDSSNGCDESGAVYLFVRDEGEWTPQAYVKAANGESNDMFGTALALSGDTLVVGVRNEEGCGPSIVHASSGGFSPLRSSGLRLRGGDLAMNRWRPLQS